ncbi:methyltransferase [Myxococcus stipitatus DSM 14675]|uniref:Methyltransferase n=1 Tax=Myxococcus stipitatus (strain DSM 14675 / JCM 12634 / Mx s8) TaxID=1278073 RepID=L7U9B9_MYXSD|nr:class I SAM-dependent methyltransferase [Myxococcus stipitatus]AGC43059.1 methyltransferase [Myxococcus stipitatus DSM 14675]
MSQAPSTSFVQHLNFLARDASNESAALQAAVSLGLLNQLGTTPVPLTELARRLAANVRGVRSVIEPLVALGFVTLEVGRGYALPESTAAFLADASFMSRLKANHDGWHAVALLPQAVRTGADVEGRDVLGWYRALFLEPQEAAPNTRAEDFFDRAARNFARTQALVTAAELGLLERWVKGVGSLEALAEASGVPARSLEVLVKVLGTMGIAREADGAWAFTEDAARMLDANSLPYFQRALPATMAYWEALGHLDEAVREQRFRLDLRDPQTARRIYQENASRISGIFASHLRLSRKAAELVRGMRSLAGARVLDVGTGSGVWGAAFGLVDPSTHVTFLDSPHVLDAVRPHLAKLKLEARSRLWEGDCLSVDYGEAAYDVILLPQIIPALPSESLPGFFAKLARALRPGGVLLISGYLLTDRRDGPLDALYFALRRYVSNEGDVLSLPEFRALLDPVGLTSARGFDMPIQQVVVAHRGEHPWPAEATQAPS